MKKYQVDFRDEALEDLDKLDKAVAQRVLNKIRWISENFDNITPERLSGDFRELYKLRIGDWRVGYTVHSELITIHIVDHRGKIYKSKRSF